MTRIEQRTSSIEPLLRELAPQALGAIVRRYGDFSAAEDAVQEALLAAARQWPKEGVPDNPRGWLIHVAARRMTDHIRSEIARRQRESEVVAQMAPDEQVLPAPDSGAVVEQDDTLMLLFMCCHPSLTPGSAIALTLRAVGGLTTAEIANAFMVPESTMAQRISRAKKTIKVSGAPFVMPAGEQRADRLAAVLQILYLIFNEGYASSIGASLQRTDLANEAIRLTRALHHQLPEDPEASGLLALMLLTDARRPARTGPDGELIPLAEQDRSLWNQVEIQEGTALLTQTLARGTIGSYQLQAAIAALHDEAARVDDTDWPQIRALYALLLKMADNPMVALNHAIAVAMVEGPQAGLALITRLNDDERISGHYRLDAVRAHLFEMSGDRARAIRHYRIAAEKTTNLPERDYLTIKAGRLANPA